MAILSSLSWIKPGEKLRASENRLLPKGNLNTPLSELLFNDVELMSQAKLLEKELKNHTHDSLYYKKDELQEKGIERSNVHIAKIFPKTAKSIYMLDTPVVFSISTTAQTLESYIGLGAAGYVFHVTQSLPAQENGSYSNTVTVGGFDISYTPSVQEATRGGMKQPGTDGHGFCICKSSNPIVSSGGSGVSAQATVIGVVE